MEYEVDSNEPDFEDGGVWKMRFRRIDWNFDGVEAKIFYHDFQGVPVKTLVIEFPEPWRALSSREGFKRVRFICNNSNPKELWPLLHTSNGQKNYLNTILSQLKIPANESLFLFTGADVDDVAIADEGFDGFRVSAFVTAGVDTNAMRIGVDGAHVVEIDGEFRNAGTINIMVLTDASLSTGAMVHSMITITEAKVIALQDLDVRSSYNPRLKATGTGTDSVVVASGNGVRVNYVGGHAKIGELMARAVTSATKEAIVKHRRRMGK